MSRRTHKPVDVSALEGNIYYTHYFMYLKQLAYQLYEWEGLPETVDPKFLEKQLHENGFVGFYKDKTIGYLVGTGAPSGVINHYLNNTKFTVISPNVNMNHTFDVYNYMDDINENTGVVIYNNDMQVPTQPSLQMFSYDLANLKQIINTNQNAQKTPYVFVGNDKKMLSLKNLYRQLDEHVPVMFIDEGLDIENSIKVFPTSSPYVVDKLNTQKNAVWNECMTWLGIKNANLEKKERMVTSEVDSNDNQIGASANVWLKARQEACDRINKVFPELNVSVKLRESAVAEFEHFLDDDKEGGS